MNQRDLKSPDPYDNSNFRCYYCDRKQDSLREYLSHTVNSHPGRLAYPDRAYIADNSLARQGKNWEMFYCTTCNLYGCGGPLKCKDCRTKECNNHE